jgi:hypothetical protein
MDPQYFFKSGPLTFVVRFFNANRIFSREVPFFIVVTIFIIFNAQIYLDKITCRLFERIIFQERIIFAFRAELKVQRFEGATVQRFYGFTVQRFNGSTVRRFRTQILKLGFEWPQRILGLATVFMFAAVAF